MNFGGPLIMFYLNSIVQKMVYNRMLRPESLKTRGRIATNVEAVFGSREAPEGMVASVLSPRGYLFGLSTWSHLPGTEPVQKMRSRKGF